MKKNTMNRNKEIKIEMNKETKASEKGKFNESETGLTLKIDNSYFSKKRNGGN